MTTVAVLGATSGIAQACQRRWAEQGCDFVLVGRDPQRLGSGADDVRARGAADVITIVEDLGTAEGVERAVAAIFAERTVDIVLIAFGVMPEQSESDSSPVAAEAVLTVTGSLNVLALHLTALRLVEQGSGTAAILGSVAGDRGRKSNYLYGAAKAMVATAAAGLQHRTAGTDVGIVLIKPGPTRTPMTDHLANTRGLASPDLVAENIVAGIERKTPVIYTPGRWRIIMSIVRLLPRQIFHRTNF